MTLADFTADFHERWEAIGAEIRADIERRPWHFNTDPLRSPSWRSELIQKDHVEHIGARFGSLFTRYRRFLQYSGLSDEAQRTEYFRRDPNVFYAAKLNEPDAAHRELTTLVQARILARQTPTEIAEGVGFEPGAIELYEAFFYDVRDRLDRRDWVFCRLLTPERDPNGLLRAAYVRGVRVINEFVGSTTSCSARDDAILATVQHKTGIAVQSIDPNDINQLKLLNTHAKLAALKVTIAAKTPQQIDYEMHIQAYLKELKWIQGTSDVDFNGDPVPPIEAYDLEAVELRSYEMYNIANGGEPPTGLPTEMPPPRSRTQPWAPPQQSPEPHAQPQVPTAQQPSPPPTQQPPQAQAPPQVPTAQQPSPPPTQQQPPPPTQPPIQKNPKPKTQPPKPARPIPRPPVRFSRKQPPEFVEVTPTPPPTSADSDDDSPDPFRN